MNLGQHQQRTWCTYLRLLELGDLTKFDYGNPQEILNIIIKHTLQYTTFPISPITFLSSSAMEDKMRSLMDVKDLIDNYLKSHDVDKLSVQFIQDYAHADLSWVSTLTS
ncbi:Triglyceride lipase-cholesterol esterase [Sesbania bispinosa]|nr:Triglyceride lipase-cholesterol esterase [Sesbania bispinosa]